jgi:hypothetical protein
MCSWTRIPEKDYPAPKEVVDYADWVAAQQVDEAVAASQAAGGSQPAPSPPRPAEEAGAGSAARTDEQG